MHGATGCPQMNAVYAAIAVAILFLIVSVGVAGANLEFVFGIVVPYAAVALFLLGFSYRILKWAGSAVPFRITTTCGQQKSLAFIKNDNLDNPHNLMGVLGRMALEVLFFRSLFRNTKAKLTEDQTLAYSRDKWLWAGAVGFHWSFLIVLLRHFRFFAEPVPSFVLGLQSLDGFFKIGVPILYFTGLILLASVTYLFLRRVVIPQLSYISLIADYFPLFLIMAIAISGILMRHFYKADIVAVKELTMGLISFQPAVPEGIGFIVFTHLFFVSALFAYFPFSKLMHLGGVFMSPTRNLANNSRRVRHVNPWNYDVKTHTYEEYEDEFRQVMENAGIPLEKAE
jgi:nitrate reductase gamma subunit